MKFHKKLVAGLMLAANLVISAHAASGGIPWDKAPIDVTNQASLQNGARIFVNYCLSCHSAAFMRYNRLQDIGLTEEQIKENLMFTTDKVGNVMKAAIDPIEAKKWFGANPPDLTLIARSRAGSNGTGADYIYTLLRSYYRDPTKPTGWNNLAFPSIGMPHPLWELQGERKPLFETHESHGQQVQVHKGWEEVTPGAMTAADYDKNVGDLVNFLQWMAEPAQNKRVKIGIFAMLFLALFTFAAWNLNKAFWKDVK